MSSDDHELEPPIDTFGARLSALRQAAESRQLSQEELLAAIADLERSFDEVEVSDAELSFQNEELITAREQVELERLRYQDLFDFAPDGYLVTDLAGVVLEANQTASSLLGVSRKALVGKPLGVFVAGTDRSLFHARLLDLAARRPADEWEVRLQPRGGEPFHALVSTTRRQTIGRRSPDLRWVVRDISRHKAAEEALAGSQERLRHAQRLEAIGRLAGGVAHSFNNLLTAIGLHAELLIEELAAAPRQRSHAEEVRSAAERGATLARQLLAFGRKQVLAPQVLSPNAALARMEGMLRQLLGGSIDLVTELDPGAGLVHADPAQLEQVILNLVVNARDAVGSSGRITLETAAVSEVADLPPGTWTRLAVSDTGTGIAPEVRERLFEPFFTTKEPDKGTGLGLSTVYGIVRQSGGHLRVESEPGRGARFDVYLPRLAGTAVPPEPEQPPAPVRPLQGNEVILLVEDEDNIREPAIEILASHGYSVLAAGGGTEALAVAERHEGKIDLLLTDVAMPGMRGDRLAELLAWKRPGIRTLYISGYAEGALDRRCDGEGCPALLPKPFSPAQLLAAIRAVLDGQRAEAQPEIRLVGTRA